MRKLSLGTKSLAFCNSFWAGLGPSFEHHYYYIRSIWRNCSVTKFLMIVNNLIENFIIWIKQSVTWKNFSQLRAAIFQWRICGTGGINVFKVLFISSKIASNPWCWLKRPDRETTLFLSITSRIVGSSRISCTSSATSIIRYIGWHRADHIGEKTRLAALLSNRLFLLIAVL